MQVLLNRMPREILIVNQTIYSACLINFGFKIGIKLLLELVQILGL
jgi:hypothetical protein